MTSADNALRILVVRGQRILLDSDLARLYGVSVKRLNEQVRRNPTRFPDDFCFQLTASEWKHVAIQIESSAQPESQLDFLRSQNATLKDSRGRHRKFLPYAFTEHGALQAANVLKSPRATEMSLFVIRAFVKMREELAANAAIMKRLAEIDRTLLQHDAALRDVYRKLLPLLAPPREKPREKIGFFKKSH